MTIETWAQVGVGAIFLMGISLGDYWLERRHYRRVCARNVDLFDRQLVAMGYPAPEKPVIIPKRRWFDVPDRQL